MPAERGDAAHDLISGRTARPPRLATGVTDELVSLIVGGKFAAGAVLPTEPLLAQSFGVSRIVVREALRFLESKGLIRVRQGQGSTVLASEEWDLLDETVMAAAVLNSRGSGLLDEIVGIRIVLESHIASEAAIRRPEEALQEMRASLARMDPDHSDKFAAADQAFHQAVVHASGNVVGSAILRSIMREASMSDSYVGHVDRVQRLKSRDGHQAVLSAIELGDPEGAAAAMRAHIYGSWLARQDLDAESAAKRSPFVEISRTIRNLSTESFNS